MSVAGPCHRSAHRLLAALCAPVLVVAGVAGCSGTNVTGSVASVVVPDVPTPLATSVQTASGNWATIPMGNLSQPLNTFWQLLFRRSGTSSWANEVEATATATNGGLVLASAGRRALIVGVRPSVNLTFTPLIFTSGQLGAWSNGLVAEPLAQRPYALAASTDGQALALVDGHGGQVLGTAGDLSQWAVIASHTALGRSAPGKACDLAALTAVGYVGGRALVGGTCGRRGVVGMFVQDDGHWQLSGPALPGALAGDRVEVLALGQAGPGAFALLALVSAKATSLVAAWSGPPGSWRMSAPLNLADSESPASYGPAASGEVFVLLANSSSGERLLVVGRGGGAWQALPAPPSGTATVAFAAGSPTDALVPSGDTLTVWVLAGAPARWRAAQVVHVPIQYGSSS